MDTITTPIFSHLSALEFTKDNGLFVAASNLSSQYWFGQLWYFSKPELAPNPKHATAMIPLEGGISDIAPLPTDSPKVLCGLDTGAVQLWEIQDSNLICSAHALEHDNFITSISVCADSTKALTSSADQKVKVWDIEEHRSMCTFKGHSDIVFSAHPHPTEVDIFVTCSRDGRLLMWDIRLPKPASVIEKYEGSSMPTCVCWQPGSAWSVAVGMECGSIVYRDCRRDMGEPALNTQTTQIHNRPVTKLAFARHRSDLIASGSEDSTAAVCQINADGISLRYKETRHRDFVQGLAWHPRTHALYTCAWDSQILQSSIDDDSLERVKERVSQMDVVENCDTASA